MDREVTPGAWIEDPADSHTSEPELAEDTASPGERSALVAPRRSSRIAVWGLIHDTVHRDSIVWKVPRPVQPPGPSMEGVPSIATNDNVSC